MLTSMITNYLTDVEEKKIEEQKEPTFLNTEGDSLLNQNSILHMENQGLTESNQKKDEEIEQQCKKISDDSYEISGDMSLQDVLELFEIPEKNVDSASQSVGGWVFENMGIIPENNQTVEINGLNITVKEVNDNRINKLIIKKSEQPNE